MSRTGHENRLAREASPYLQQHGHNPVDWFPWGEEALAEAKRRDVPILLSIGYSACHWCHVMERESFEDEAIAARMNASFVNVKVDREERPDLDQIYQVVVQLLGRSGGWPLTVFLTPDQKPFFGGTYFPPVDRYGMASFPQILEAIADAYRTKREDVVLQADEIATAIADVTNATRTEGAYSPGPDLLERAVRPLARRFDDENGGFGGRPKFPSTMSLDVLLRRGVLEKDPRSQERVRTALGKMRAGGIYDHLGGGFHRYSTDERWLVPHFEKMLYDNALLLRLYADGARVFGDPGYRETVREIAAYVAREMTSPEGGFYATQDADSEGEEGKFFVWDEAEIGRALEGDLAPLRSLVVAHFGVTGRGNFEETGKTVLSEVVPPDALAVKLGRAPSEVRADLARAKAHLFEAREARVKPFRDEKVLASWNGLMIGALADAGASLGDAAMVGAAEKAMAFVEARLVVRGEGGLTVQRHTKGGVVKGPGFLDDYAFLADAALDLYEATGNPRYVTLAEELARALLARFQDAEGSGFFFTPSDGEKLIHRAKDPFDHAIPSGASIACKALLRLASLRAPELAAPAEAQLRAVAAAAVENPFGMSQSIAVLDGLVRGPTEVVLVGARTDPRTQALARVALEAYLPNRVLAWVDPSDPATLAACAVLAEGKPAGAEPVAYVCRNRTCSPPLTSPSALANALAAR